MHKVASSIYLQEFKMFKAWNFFTGVIVGLTIGAITIFSHSDRQVIGGHVIRYGFLLAMLLIVLTQLWIGRYTGSRLTTLGFALAWLVATMWFGAGTADNDMSLPQSNWSTAYVAIGALLVTMVASIPVLKSKS